MEGLLPCIPRRSVGGKNELPVSLPFPFLFLGRKWPRRSLDRRGYSHAAHNVRIKVLLLKAAAEASDTREGEKGGGSLFFPPF